MDVYPNMEVSHGTMRNEDLLSSFGSLLERIATTQAHTALANEAASLIELGNTETDDASDVVQELFVALDEYAPHGCYFGSHEGDGAAYGFWSLGDDG